MEVVLSYYEVIGIDHKGQLVALADSTYAGTALNQMRAAARSKMPLSSIFVRKDGVSIDPDELAQIAQDEPNA